MWQPWGSENVTEVPTKSNLRTNSRGVYRTPCHFFGALIVLTAALRVLILEDRPSDAELVQFELTEAGVVFTPKVVATEKGFVSELQEFCPDLILSDYDLPQYNGALALAEAKRICPDSPFILVTGAIGEDRAIEILTQGAKDYVLKSRLQQRLVPAVRRAMMEAEEHKARKKAEAELREAHRTLADQIEERTSELQESRERLSLALASSGMGIFEWNISENKRYWDENVHSCMGTKAEEFTGTPEEFFKVIHPEDRGAVQDDLTKAIDQDAPYETEFRVIWPDKSVHYIAARGKVQRDKNGRPFRILGVCWEFTKHKQAEENLAKQAVLLQERANQLEAANKDLESFGFTVSHDLRAPLRGIISCSQAILKEQVECFREETQRKFEMITHSAETMSRLIDDLLAFSRLGSQAVTKRNLRMEELVEEVWQELVTIHPTREMSLKIGQLPVACGDRSLIRQVYGNLLGNAVKFTKTREAAVIEAGSTSVLLQ